MPLHLPFIPWLALGTILTVDIMANIIFPIRILADGTCVCVCVCVYVYLKGTRKYGLMYLPFPTVPACFVEWNLYFDVQVTVYRDKFL